MRIEIVELKKGLFNISKKTFIKACSLQDLEEWVRLLEKIPRVK